MASIRDRVFDQITAIKFQGGEPQKIYLTPEDERELSEAGPDVLGRVVYDRVQEVGIREALKRYMGMRVFWDADETKVK